MKLIVFIELEIGAGSRRGVGSYRWGLKEEKMKVLKLDLLMVQMGEFIFMEDIKAILQLMTGYQKLVVMII